MTKAEFIEYENKVKMYTRNIERYKRKLFELKQISFTNNQMISRFYKHAEIDLQDAIEHIKHGFELHEHYIKAEWEQKK